MVRSTAVVLLIAGLAIACSSSPKQSARPVASSQPASEETRPIVPAAPPPVTVEGLQLAEGAPGMRLEIAASGPLVWTSYRDDRGDLVVELPNSVPGTQLVREVPGEGIVAWVKLEEDASGSRPLTRLTVRTTDDAEPALSAEGNLLRLELTPQRVEEPAEIAEAAPTEPAGGLTYEPVEAEAPAPVAEVEAVPVTSASSASTTLAEDLGTPDRPRRGTALAGQAATRLESIKNGGGGTFNLVGNGSFTYSTFRLEGPARLVIDLEGVLNAASRSSLAVGEFGVERVRVAQFRPAPQAVARVVFDLDGSAWPMVEATGTGLAVRFGAPAPRVAEAAPAPAVERSEPARQASVREPAPAAPPVAEPEPSPAPEPEPARVATTQIRQVESEPAPRVPTSGRPASPLLTASRNAEGGALSDVELYGGGAKAAPAPEPAPDAAPAGTKTVATKVFGSRTIGTAERTYYGEPITMSMRDADLVETLRSFAAISGLSIVVQPEVKGTVTVELDNVPWDQALEQILRVNKLGYELEGTVMRIAPVAILKAEADEQQQLEAAKALQVPLKTVLRRLSYSNATDISRLLRTRGELLSQRGSVIVDRRTNTLIIKELPSFIDTVIAVIDELDTPEPQVMIEARIVETTKRFTRSLGVQWAFEGISAPQFGNTTGLVFPNRGTVEGGVNLITGGRNGILGLTLGNVLNTFNVDVALQAAETEGLIKILSAPKVAVLNNEEANIQSGLQIPIQTVTNGSFSVQFINATLSLEVTPHVTAEGTVLMDIAVRKREPQLAFAIQGATNAPIATKEARTKVIVRDGGTTVIGGIYKMTSDTGVDKVPGLANVPILGHLFKNKRRSDENEELLIFITPRVINL
jgi:type IV pilus secretin PilQ/predicted competence protein